MEKIKKIKIGLVIALLGTMLSNFFLGHAQAANQFHEDYGAVLTTYFGLGCFLNNSILCLDPSLGPS